MKNKNIVNIVFLFGFLVCFSALCFIIVKADTASSSASVTNVIPVASSATIVGGDITLTTNVTTTVNSTVTITDNNGCEDIDSVTAKLFRTNISGGSGASDNNRTHYSSTCVTNSDCTAGGSDLTETYYCLFYMDWYADPTDAGSLYAGTNWTFNVTPSDEATGTPDNDVQEVKTLTSISLNISTIDFSTLALGANTTTTNSQTGVLNLGNEGLDVKLTGYGASPGDNLSMNCTWGDISIHYLEYSSSGFTYGSGTDLTNTSTELDLDVAQGSESTPRPVKPIYYGFGLPLTGVGGSCTGTVTITAHSDPTTD